MSWCGIRTVKRLSLRRTAADKSHHVPLVGVFDPFVEEVFLTTHMQDYETR